MKKTLLFGAAIFAAMTMNAAVWDFTTNPINTVALLGAVSSNDGFTISEKSFGENGEFYAAIDYIGKAPDVATLTFTDAAPISMRFTFVHKSDDKTEVAKIYPTYFQFNRQYAALEIDCNVGDVITFYPKSYSKATFFTVTGAQEESVLIDANSEEPVSVTATATTVKFDTSLKPNGESQACQILKISVGSTESALHNVSIAEKISFNGSVISNAEGLNVFVYNALGKLVANSNGDINMDSFQSGVYLVRAEGIKSALKIRK